MTDMLPIIRQMHDADGDRERAKILLACPDLILLKFAGVLDEACQRARFAQGSEYLLSRIATMRAVRGADGLLPADRAADFDAIREKFARFAAFDPEATEV